MSKKELIEPYFVNYAIRGCQCHENFTQETYFKGYPKLYGDKSSQSAVDIGKTMYNEPSTNFSYVFKGFTGGS